MVLAGLLGLLLPNQAAGIRHTHESQKMVADAPTSGRAPDHLDHQGHPAVSLAQLLSLIARAPSTPSPAEAAPLPADAPIPYPMEAPESGLGNVEADDELNDLDDFAYHLRVVFDGTAQLNRIVEPCASLGARAHSRLADNRSDKPPRS